MAARSAGKANPEIESAMKALLKDVKSGKDSDGKPYSLTDKMRIMDRVLKWEAIKSKLEGSDWGSEFSKGDD